MKPLRRSATAALTATLAYGSLLVVTAAPAWAPTCGSSCGMYPTPPNPPTSTAQCKDDGWRHYTDAQGFAFANQGTCVSSIAGDSHARGASTRFPGNPG